MLAIKGLSQCFRVTPAEILWLHGFSEAGNEYRSLPRTNPDRSAIQRVYPASLFMAAFELCQRKHFAPTVEHCWAINIIMQAFFTFVWCKNSGSFRHQVLHRKAGRAIQRLPRVLLGKLANILFLSGSWLLLLSCNASVSITKIACGRAPNKALVGTPSAPHNFALCPYGNFRVP